MANDPKARPSARQLRDLLAALPLDAPPVPVARAPESGAVVAPGYPAHPLTLPMPVSPAPVPVAPHLPAPVPVAPPPPVAGWPPPPPPRRLRCDRQGGGGSFGLLAVVVVLALLFAIAAVWLIAHRPRLLQTLNPTQSVRVQMVQATTGPTFAR
jgi:hypothetical protein